MNKEGKMKKIFIIILLFIISLPIFARKTDVSIGFDVLTPFGSSARFEILDDFSIVAGVGYYLKELSPFIKMDKFVARGSFEYHLTDRIRYRGTDHYMFVTLGSELKVGIANLKGPLQAFLGIAPVMSYYVIFDKNVEFNFQLGPSFDFYLTNSNVQHALGFNTTLSVRFKI